MPGSPQNTELSLPFKRTGKQVIEFLTPPIYRACRVDISKSTKVEFYGLVNYKGKLRAWVANVTQTTQKCRVTLDGCHYIVHQSYHGSDVSAGIKEI